MKKYLKLARFDHYIKNIFMFPGVIFAIVAQGYVADNYALIIKMFVSFFSLCFISSANYTINEFLDAEFDRYHPVKKNRISVVERLNKKIIVMQYILFASGGLVISYFVNSHCFFASASLLLMGLLYNVKPIRMKDLPFIDVLSESVNNAIRLLIGWYVVSTSLIVPASLVVGYWLGERFLWLLKDIQNTGSLITLKQQVFTGSHSNITPKNHCCYPVFFMLCSLLF